MRLVEKVAVVMAASIISQIACSHGMPRNQPKRKSENIKVSDAKKKYNENMPFKSTVIDTEIKRFPNVDYPLDFDQAEYYRFLNDYPVQFKPNCFTQTQPKNKRKFEIAPKVKPETSCFTKNYHQLQPAQPYCFRNSSFFPDVEYPLSARDMWMPKSWNRLQDVNQNGNGESNRAMIPTSKSTLFANSNTDYETSDLNLLIKTLNTRKTQVPDKSDNVIDIKLPIQKETIPINGTDTEGSVPTKVMSTSAVTIVPIETSANIFTPLDYYDSSTYNNVGTTAQPFQSTTPPMSESNNSEPIYVTPTTIAPNPVLTTDAPIPTLDNVVAYDYPQIIFDLEEVHLINNFTLNGNDSSTTYPLPTEESDDWVIYVDTVNSTNDVKIIEDENILCTYCDTWNYSMVEESQMSNGLNSTFIISNTQADKRNKSQEVTQNTPNDFPELNITKNTEQCAIKPIDPVYSMIESNFNEKPIATFNNTMDGILYFEDSNSTLLYEYIDDILGLCTEMPYDLVIYSEYGNDTESTLANTPYILY